METVKGPDRNHDEVLISLVDRYQSSLLRLCFIYLHDKALAEDAVQETLPKTGISCSRTMNGCTITAGSLPGIPTAALPTCRRRIRRSSAKPSRSL